MVAAAIAGGAVASAGIGAVGSSAAAGKSAGAAAQSAQLQAQMMNQNLARADPFITQGQIAAQQLPGAVGVPMDLSGQPTYASLPQAPTAPDPFVWNPTMQGLEQTPGYQFTLQQGLQATQSAAAAKGLGVSGAALQGAANYATGLASNTYNQQLTNAINAYNVNLNRYGQQVQGYGQQIAGFGAAQGAYQNQFNDYWANQQNRFNQLQNIATLGANAGAQAGSQMTQGAASIGNAVQAQGQAQAAGIMGPTNALTGGINNAVGGYVASQYLPQMFGSNPSYYSGNPSSLGALSQPGATGTWQGLV